MNTQPLALTFTSGQQVALARSACKRLLATPSARLTRPQKPILTAVLGDLGPIGTDAGGWTLQADLTHMQALHYAVTRQFEYLSGSGTIDAPGTDLFACHAILRRLPPFAIWTEPRRPTTADVVQFVRLGFGDNHGLGVRSLHFEVGVPDRPTFEACLTDGIISYNQFDGAAAAFALGPLWNDISAVTVGRDSDPVVRIRLPQTHQQRNGGDNTASVPLTGDQLSALVATVLDAARSCGASTLIRSIGPPPQLSEQARRPAEMTLSWRD